MANVDEILQALIIGIVVGSFLLQRCRYTKAIELLSECLVVLQKHSSKLKKNKLNEFQALIHYNLFKVFFLVGEYENAIHNGEKAFPLYHEIGDLEGAAEMLEKIGDVYRLTGEEVKAKERYEKAFTFHASVMIASNVFGMSSVRRKEHLNKMLVVTNKADNKEMEGQLLIQLGDLFLSLFEYSNAKDCFQRALAIWKEKGNRKEEGNALYCLGNLCRKTDEYQEAKQHYEEAMTIFEDAGELKKLGDVFGELGKVYNSLHEYKKAKTLQQKALKVSVKSGDKRGESIDYRNLADAHISLGEYREAEECYQKALAISKDEGDRKGEAFVYSDLGYFYQDHNVDLKRAEHFCQKACEIYREIDDMLDEGSENSHLGKLYCHLGRYDDARKCYERALAIQKEIGDRREEGKACCNLGTLYQSLGDYGKAKECHQHALAISKETNDLRGQGVDHGNLGTVWQHLGDYDKAYEHHKKALEIAIRTGHKEGLPAAYNHLGLVCELRGEYVNANNLFRKALKIANEIGDRRVESKILCSLASLEQTIGERKKAIEYCRGALQISKDVNDIRQEGVLNGNLGAVYQSLGDLTTAKQYLENSLAITKLIGSKDGEGTVLGNLGAVQISLGENTKARKCFEQALEISRETVDKKGEMTMYQNLGMLHLSNNEFQKALSCFKSAHQICDQMGDLRAKSINYCSIAVVYFLYQDIPKALSYLSNSINCLEEMRILVGENEYYKVGFADENTGPYRLMVSVLLKLECVPMALTISELARARSLAEVMAQQYSSHDLPGFNPNRWIDFGNVIQKKSCTGLSFWFVHENLLCWVLKTAKIEVVTNKGLTTDITPQSASIQHWLETLADQCYRKILLLQGEQCEDRSLILSDKDAEVRSPTQVKETHATSEIEKNQEECQKDPPALRDLYNIIIAPVLKFLEGSEMIIVPDRSLYRIPFAALKDESGEYLSEKFRIRVIPSLTTLKLIQDSPANYHSQKGVLIVGDPEVGLEELPPLPFARKEVEMIGQLLNARPLVGKQATKQTVLQRIHSVGLIHIAAHGNADKGEIALAPARNITCKGLLKKEDFLLTMSDISKVQLRAKLVVLSCCHSGRGQIKAEGVVGIARAFLGSGARSVLVSLWAVDDEATMQFMKQFYGHLVRGKSASESLHETMKWMRENTRYREVRKWAPFMLIGDDVSFDFADLK